MNLQFLVKPPFVERYHAVTFLVVIVFCIVWPILNDAVFQTSASQVYSTIPPRYRNYAFMGRSIEAGVNVDVLVVGPSHLWSGINIEVLEAEMSKALGRPITAVNFGSAWFGLEADYSKIHNALKTIKPKIVLVADSPTRPHPPHQLTKYLWRPLEMQAPMGLSTFDRLSLYAASMLGAPHRFWSDVQGGAKFTAERQKSVDKYIKDKGFNNKNTDQYGWLSHDDSNEKNRRKFIDHNHPMQKIPADNMIFKGQEDENFSYLNPSYDCYQSAFLLAIGDKVKASGAVFATLSLPTHWKNRPMDRTLIRRLCNDTGKPWAQIGVPVQRLFENVPYDQMLDYYHNETHLNAAGAKRFTIVIAPAIVKLIVDAK